MISKSHTYLSYSSARSHLNTHSHTHTHTHTHTSTRTQACTSAHRFVIMMLLACLSPRLAVLPVLLSNKSSGTHTHMYSFTHSFAILRCVCTCVRVCVVCVYAGAPSHWGGGNTLSAVNASTCMTAPRACDLGRRCFSVIHWKGKRVFRRRVLHASSKRRWIVHADSSHGKYFDLLLDSQVCTNTLLYHTIRTPIYDFIASLLCCQPACESVGVSLTKRQRSGVFRKWYTTRSLR